MMREIIAMLRGQPSQQVEIQNRELQALRPKLRTEVLGLKRANIVARTTLLNELIDGPKRHQ